MVEFKSRFSLYKLLVVPTLPIVHWSDGSSWLMASHIYDFVKKRMREIIGAATCVALTCDETSIVDNTSWMAIHMYVMQNWARVPMLVHL